MKNVLITGTTGLAAGLKKALDQEYNVTCISESTGHDIRDVEQWLSAYAHYDILVNCAYCDWGQVKVLEQFYYAWKDMPDKTIINIGSMITDYARSETHKNHEYLAYRNHKLALAHAFNYLVRLSECDIKLVNPGAIDTAMVSHLTCNKFTIDEISQKIKWLIKEPVIKRLDLWV